MEDRLSFAVSPVLENFSDLGTTKSESKSCSPRRPLSTLVLRLMLTPLEPLWRLTLSPLRSRLLPTLSVSLPLSLVPSPILPPKPPLNRSVSPPASPPESRPPWSSPFRPPGPSSGPLCPPGPPSCSPRPLS